MGTVKILRITRHKASPKQVEALQRAFGGNIEVKTVSETLPSNAREAVSRFDELAHDYEVVEAVLPVNLLESVLKFSNFSTQGGRLIRAVMNRKTAGDEVEFEFDHYEVVKKVEVVTTPL